MSAVKAFKADATHAREMARAAAGKADQGTRVRAYLSLCEELGEAARSYADPLKAARVLVHIAAYEYAAKRKGA